MCIYGEEFFFLTPAWEWEGEKSWRFVGMFCRLWYEFLLKSSRESPTCTALPCHSPRLMAKSTGRKCLLSSSLVYFLSLYYWSVRIIYKSDHTDVLFRYFLCESLTQLSFTLALALNRGRSGFKDDTSLLIHPDCLMASSYRLQPGHSAVFLAASPSTLLTKLQVRLWLRQTCKTS